MVQELVISDIWNTT